MGIWSDGKDGFSERCITCYPREINVFVGRGRKSTAGEGGERVEIKDESVLDTTRTGWDLYPRMVSSLKAKSFPNNGVAARRRPPLPGDPARYVRGVFWRGHRPRRCGGWGRRGGGGGAGERCSPVTATLPSAFFLSVFPTDSNHGLVLAC
jgi:hypothetical protein